MSKVNGLDDRERLEVIKQHLGDALNDWVPEAYEPKTTKRGNVLRAWRLAAFEPVDGEPRPSGVLKVDPGVPSNYILVPK